jgi:hypothetical protein
MTDGAANAAADDEHASFSIESMNLFGLHPVGVTCRGGAASAGLDLQPAGTYQLLMNTALESIGLFACSDERLQGAENGPHDGPSRISRPPREAEGLGLLLFIEHRREAAEASPWDCRIAACTACCWISSRYSDRGCGNRFSPSFASSRRRWSCPRPRRNRLSLAVPLAGPGPEDRQRSHLPQVRVAPRADRRAINPGASVPVRADHARPVARLPPAFASRRPRTAVCFSGSREGWHAASDARRRRRRRAARWPRPRSVAVQLLSRERRSGRG